MFLRVGYKLATRFPRLLSNSSQSSGTSGEKLILNLLKAKFSGTSDVVTVEDISGGCGAMYQVYVKSDKLIGASVVEQHKMINNILKEQIKNMHGIRIVTET